MAINLHVNHLSAIAQDFKNKSYLKGKSSDKYSFTGLKGIKVSTLRSVPTTPYTRAGLNRYGTPIDMQDSVQEMIVTKDEGFAIVVDKGDNSEQQKIKNAAAAMRVQMDEQIIPLADKHGFFKMIYEAGLITTGNAPAKATIVDLMADAIVHLQDANVPVEQCYIAVTSEVHKLLMLSTEFIAIEALGKKSIERGVVGEFMGASVLRVPSSLLKDHGVYFIAWHPSALIMPDKLHDTKIHTDPPGISGHLLEGRFIFDTFVLGAKSNAVYAYGASTMARATLPVIATVQDTTDANVYGVTLTVATGEHAYFTTDGTDPRYSNSRILYSAPVEVDVKQGDTPAEIRTNGGKLLVKAVAYKANTFPSAVAVSSTTI